MICNNVILISALLVVATHGVPADATEQVKDFVIEQKPGRRRGKERE